MIRLRAVAKNLLLLVSSLIIFTGLLEGAVRLIEPREVMRYFFMTADTTVDHRFIPGARGRYETTEFNVPYNIDSWGLRDGEFPMEKPRGTRRILMLGDSFTEGDGVREEDTFSHRLQVLLDSAYTPGSWQVINAGVGSYSPLLEYIYLTRKGLAFTPDLVILNFDLSDIYDDINYTSRARFDSRGLPVGVEAEAPEAPKEGIEAGLIGVKDFFKDHTRLYNFIRLRIDRYLEGARRKMNVSGDVRYDKYAFLRENYVPRDSDWALSFRYVRLIRDTLKARGIDFWLTVYPYGLQVNPKEWDSGRQFWGFKPDTLYSTRPQDFMEQFCRHNGIPVINLCSDFRTATRAVYPLYYDYNGHWRPEGHAIVAHRLFQSITSYVAGVHHQ
ncbi:MAG: hypothetical protein WB699_18135 [Bacteroidota bacterium]